MRNPPHIDEFQKDPSTNLLPLNQQALTLEQVIAIWLHSKGGRSGSAGTLRAYRETITHFRGAIQRAGLDLDGDRATLQTIAQGWAARPWRADLAGQGAQVSNATYNRRLAALSSFYEFGIGRGWFVSNPIKGLERRQMELYSGAQPMQPEEVAAALAKIDRSKPAGERDYTLLFLGLATGRRAMELAGLRAGDIQFIGIRRLKIHWRRIKGGKSHTDTIEDQEIIGLLRSYLAHLYGCVQGLEKDAAVWPSYSNHRRGQPIGYEALRHICEKRLSISEVHALRHTFTALMGETGATIEEKQAALLHSKIDTTQRYDRKLHGQVNRHAGTIARRLLIRE
ncbi:MAG TPA: tyrosine-type recombinase/integrase [Ktedonobacteraceae bacterium]|nr:tyrosine-type recombinase/integrase [Ktedonobacteraceae bacterium]